MEELRIIVTSKDEEPIELRQHIIDLQNAAASKDSVLHNVTLNLKGLRKTTSAEIRNKDEDSNALR